MAKYLGKRIGFGLLSVLVIMLLTFVLIKLVEPPGLESSDPNLSRRQELLMEAMGYNRPILEQFVIYVKNIVTKWDWGYSFKLSRNEPVWDIIFRALPPTMLINVYSLIIGLPIGLILGIYAALKKYKWQDNVISVGIMIIVSVPSYVYAFVVQYFLCFKLQWFPITMLSLADAGGTWFTKAMFLSMMPAILSLSFGEIASLARSIRAELTEQLSQEYMLLARTKGLTRRQAIMGHALKNAMVPVFPDIVAAFISVLAGSVIIESIFSVPGVGNKMLQAFNMLDYNVLMATLMFYTLISVFASIIIDLSYGFIDPRIRMGSDKGGNAG